MLHSRKLYVRIFFLRQPWAKETKQPDSLPALSLCPLGVALAVTAMGNAFPVQFPKRTLPLARASPKAAVHS